MEFYGLNWTQEQKSNALKKIIIMEIGKKNEVIINQKSSFNI